MNASADRRNVLRTLMVYLCAANIGTSVIIPPGDDRVPDIGTPSWVRVSFQDIAAVQSGRQAGDHMVRQDALVSVDCFTPSLATQLVGSVDDVDGIASRVASALRFRDLPLKDYVSDASGATAITGAALRNMAPPTILTPAPVEGYQRRTVQARVYWFARHQET